jgi:hypothetical protein
MKTIFIILNLAVCAGVYAQQLSEDVDPSIIADDLARYADDDINYQELYENYLQLLSDPIDVNKATTEELRLSLMLSENQITNLKDYILQNGRLMSVYELQAVPDFDTHTIAKILPLIKVVDESELIGKPLFKRMLRQGNTYFVARYERTLETSEGYHQQMPEKEFQGTPDKLYLRFRSNRNKDYSIGFTGEKDAGERLQWDTSAKKYAMDYWSFHAQILNKKIINNLIIGDFQYQFGQGLILGNSFGFGKGGETVSAIRKSNIGFSPYTSVNEGGYMRGAAVTLQLHKKLQLSTFYSDAKRDATVHNDSLSEFSALLSTGLHRNDQELLQKHSIEEWNYGSVLNFKTANTDAGIIFQSITFSLPWNRNPTSYNQFAFEGKQNSNAGFFFNHTFRNINFFSEGAKTLNGGSGLVAGLLASVDPKLDFALLFRNYQRDYISFYSNGFSENTTPQNETGMYWGWKYKINRKYSVSAYVDLFKFPWLKFRTYKPSNGNEILLRLQYQPSRKIVLYAQARQEKKEKNISNDSFLYTTSVSTKRNLLLNCDYTISENLRMKTRAQLSEYNFEHSTTSGVAIMQDVIIKVKRFQISGRFALFDTDDFENRQYAYENDAWLAYSLPAYYGQGVKNYLMVQYKFTRSLTIWLRYSRAKYSNQDEIGSGTNLIIGNTQNDVKLQLRLVL